DVVLVHYARRLLRSRQPPGGPQGGFLAELRHGPTVNRIDVPPAVQAVRLVILVVVVVTVPFAKPHFGGRAGGIALAVTLVVSAAAWVIWTFAGDRPRLWVAMLALMGAAGGVLAGVSSLSTAVAVGFVVAVSAGARLSTEVSSAIVAETV